MQLGWSNNENTDAPRELTQQIAENTDCFTLWVWNLKPLGGGGEISIKSEAIAVNGSMLIKVLKNHVCC